MDKNKQYKGDKASPDEASPKQQQNFNKDEFQKKFLTRLNKAKENRSDWETTLRQAYELFQPYRSNGFNGNTRKGKDKSPELHDDIGVQTCRDFCNDLKSKLLPNGERWANIVVGSAADMAILREEADEEEIEELNKRLQHNAELLFAYIQSSNFDGQVIQSIQDMAISTGALFIEDTKDIDSPIKYHAVPIDQLIVEESAGEIKTAWREWDMTGNDVAARWGFNNLPEKAQQRIKKNPQSKYCIYEGTMFDAIDNCTYYAVLINIGSKADDKIITVYKIDDVDNPWVVFRWDQSIGETMGRGPALDCLKSMKKLNKLNEQMLMNNAIAISPPAVVDSGRIVNTNIPITAGGRIVAKSLKDGSSNNRPAVEFLQTGANFNTAIQMEADLKQSIKDAFYRINLPPVNAGGRTATEFSIREREAEEKKSAAYSKLERELVSSIIKKTYNILMKKGLLDRIDIGNEQVVKVTSVSPLVDIQNMKDVESVIQYVQTMQGIGGEQGMQLAASEMDIALLPSHIADLQGVPASLRLSPSKKREQQAQLRQQVAQGGIVPPNGVPPENPVEQQPI